MKTAVRFVGRALTYAALYLLALALVAGVTWVWMTLPIGGAR